MNTSERLGCASDARLLILHVDDLGLCHSINAAFIAAIGAGLVNSGSIMVPCPWFPEIARYATANPDIDVGLHLTLSSAQDGYRWRPVTPASEVPGLVDGEGYMWRSSRQTAARASIKEVAIELRAQIERALAFGINPTHLDAHAGLSSVRREYFDIFMDLSSEYGIPLQVLRPTEKLLSTVRKSGLTVNTDRLLQAEADGALMLDELVVSTDIAGNTFDERFRSYERVLRNLKPGVTQVVLHLGLGDAELQAITSLADEWATDYRIFTHATMVSVVREAGIRLMTWREMAELAGLATAQ